MSKKIRVGIDMRDLRIAKTGARTYLEEITKELKKPDPQFEFLYFDTIFPVYTGKNKFLKFFEHIRFFCWKQIQLPFLAWTKNCTILFCTDYFVPYFQKGFVAIPVFYDAFFWEFPQYYNPYWLRVFKSIGIAAAKKSPYVVTITEYAKKQIAHFSGMDASKIISIYLAPKTMELDSIEHKNLPISNRSNSLLKQPYILHVGTFEKRKNLRLLVEAFDELVKDGFSQYQLLLIGQASSKKDLDDSDAIKELIRVKHLEDKVIIPGFVSNAELVQLYQGAAIYVFPSLNEGFGIPVLEAFSYRVPVLIANNSCLPEIAGDAAISFDPYDHSALAQKMKLILSDKSLQESYVQKGLIQLKRYSWNQSAAELKALFFKVSQGK